MEEGTPWLATFGDPPRYPIESVDNALRLLAILLSRSTVRVKDAATELGVAAGTAHRLLASLKYRGYVTQEPVTKMYRPGPTLMSIGAGAHERSEIRISARPYLERLNRELDETIQLATLYGREVHFLDAVESSKALRTTSRAGTLRPAHCTSVGKALLAELPDDALAALYPDNELPIATPNSISTRSELLEQITMIRSRGYAMNVSELEDGIGSVAVAVHERGSAVAAIGAGGPLSRMQGNRMDVMAMAVKSAVREFERALN